MRHEGRDRGEVLDRPQRLTRVYPGDHDNRTSELIAILGILYPGAISPPRVERAPAMEVYMVYIGIRVWWWQASGRFRKPVCLLTSYHVR